VLLHGVLLPLLLKLSSSAQQCCQQVWLRLLHRCAKGLGHRCPWCCCCCCWCCTLRCGRHDRLLMLLHHLPLRHLLLHHLLLLLHQLSCSHSCSWGRMGSAAGAGLQVCVSCVLLRQLQLLHGCLQLLLLNHGLPQQCCSQLCLRLLHRCSQGIGHRGPWRCWWWWCTLRCGRPHWLLLHHSLLPSRSQGIAWPDRPLGTKQVVRRAAELTHQQQRLVLMQLALLLPP